MKKLSFLRKRWRHCKTWENLFSLDSHLVQNHIYRLIEMLFNQTEVTNHFKCNKWSLSRMYSVRYQKTEIDSKGSLSL